MDQRLVWFVLIAGLCAACTTPNYKSPAPTRAQVEEVQAQIEAVDPDREPLTADEANAVARPIFEALAGDAARICRTVSEADTCVVPTFAVLDLDHVNARAGFGDERRPDISLTRGLVEQLADQPDELALVIGHQYGHLIAAHIEEAERHDGLDGSVVGNTLSVPDASTAAARDGKQRHYPPPTGPQLGPLAGSTGKREMDGSYRTSRGPVYSQREIDDYLQGNDAPDPAYWSFSRGQEIEADYLGTYLATRSGYAPTGSAFIEIGALDRRDGMTPLQKQNQQIPFDFWDRHPHSPDRVARIQETLEEIEALKVKGYARPIPPRLILDITDNVEAFHSLEELVAPLP